MTEEDVTDGEGSLWEVDEDDGVAVQCNCVNYLGHRARLRRVSPVSETPRNVRDASFVSDNGRVTGMTGFE